MRLFLARIFRDNYNKLAMITLSKNDYYDIYNGLDKIITIITVN